MFKISKKVLSSSSKHFIRDKPNLTPLHVLLQHKFSNIPSRDLEKQKEIGFASDICHIQAVQNSSAFLFALCYGKCCISPEIACLGMAASILIPTLWTNNAIKSKNYPEDIFSRILPITTLTQGIGIAIVGGLLLSNVPAFYISGALLSYLRYMIFAAELNRFGPSSPDIYKDKQIGQYSEYINIAWIFLDIFIAKVPSGPVYPLMLYFIGPKINELITGKGSIKSPKKYVGIEMVLNSVMLGVIASILIYRASNSEDASPKNAEMKTD